MLYIIPTATDAPCYHFPYATIGMIALNTVVLGLQFLFPDAAQFFILHHGVPNPITWFSSCCMHADFWHLLGNMIGLAICGWIIEGKVGWKMFIAIYFAIGAASCAIEHLIMFWISNGGSLGASGVIFGMLAIIMIWAPENKITLSYAGLLFVYPVGGSFTVTIMEFCFFMIAVEFLTVWFTFFQLSSSMLHLMGAIPGAAIGYFMVKKRLVDCEGYDLMSIQSGREGERVITVAQEREAKANRKRARSEARMIEQDGLAKVEVYIRDGHYEFAWRRFCMLQRKNPSLVMREDQYVSVINGMFSNPATKERSIEVMKSYLRHYNRLRVPIVLNIAKHVLLVENRPRQCIEVIRQIDGQTLEGKHLKSATRLVRAARKKIAAGSLDFADL